MTYEEQLVKWASKKFDLEHKDIFRVDLDINYTAYTYEECGCCGPYIEKEMSIDVIVLGHETESWAPSQHKRLNFREFYISEYGDDFHNLMKEIFEA